MKIPSLALPSTHVPMPNDKIIFRTAFIISCVFVASGAFAGAIYLSHINAFLAGRVSLYTIGSYGVIGAGIGLISLFERQVAPLPPKKVFEETDVEKAVKPFKKVNRSSDIDVR